MRFYFSILLCILVAFGSFGQQRGITLNAQNMRVAEVIERLEATTPYRFVYQTAVLKNTRNVRAQWRMAPLEQVLKDLFENSNVDYKVRGNQIILLAREASALPTDTYHLLKGTVIDEGGEPLPGVSVYVEKNNGKPEYGTMTNAAGQFELRVASGKWMSFSLVGYKPARRRVSGPEEAQIRLQPGTHSLDEVVVVGYGETNRRDLTGRVATLSADELVTMPAVGSFDRMMGGKMSGVYAAQVSGNPAAGAMVNIRGVASFRGNSQPLYIIDGIPVLTSENLSEQVEFSDDGLQIANPLLALNPQDIESVSVLKDASAAAMYGSRAANGVIIVTTKRGAKSNGVQLNLQSSTTLQAPVRMYNLMNAAEYRAYAEQLAKNTLALEDSWNINKPLAEAILANKRPQSAEPFFLNGDTNWQRELTRPLGVNQNITLTTTGNTGVANFYLSGQYNITNGVFKGNRLNRSGIQANLDVSATKWLTLGTSLNYSANALRESGVNSFEYTFYNPTIPKGFRLGQSALEVAMPQPIDFMKTSINQETQNILSNLYADVRFHKNLVFKTELAASWIQSNSVDFTSVEIPVSTGLNGRKVVTNNRILNTTFTNTLTYYSTFGQNQKLDIVAGAAYDNRSFKADKMAYIGFVSNELNAFPGQQLDRRSTWETAQDAVLHSYFIRSNYRLYDRYYLTLTARADGSSKFGPNNRWGVFPSAAVSWRLSDESFLKKAKSLDNLSVKFSLGRTGNSNLPTFSYINVYTNTTSDGSLTYAGQNAVVSTQIPNLNIKWEYTNQFDLSTDFSFWQRRLYGSLGLYFKQSRNVIAYPNLMPSTGFPSQPQNVGSLDNKGIELELGSSVLRRKNLLWDMSFNITHNQNKLISLNNANAFSKNTPRSMQEGRPLGLIYGYLVEGIIQNQEELTKLNEAAPSGNYSESAKVGNFKYTDIDGDGEITELDQIELGSTLPKFFGGLSSTLQYNRWQLYTDFQFTLGQTLEYGTNRLFRYGDYTTMDRNQIRNSLANTWSPDNPTGQQEYAALGGQSYEITKSVNVFRTDFLRFKTLALGYNVPLEKNQFFKSVQARLTASNLLTLTRWPGLDPESIMGSRGAFSTAFTTEALSEYPLFRSLNFSLNVGF